MEPTYPNAVPDDATDGSALQGPVIDPSAVAEPPNDSSAQFANVGNHHLLKTILTVLITEFGFCFDWLTGLSYYCCLQCNVLQSERH